MKTLFSRVLIWFVALSIVLSGGFLVLDLLSDVEGPPGGGPAARLVLEAVVRAWEQGGSAGVAEYIERIEADHGIRVVAVDRNGTSLADGADRSELLETQERLGRFSRSSPFTFSARQADGIQVFGEILRPPPPSFWAYRAWMVAAVIGLCYVLARHLTAPVESLRTAVERFGSGDLSARVNSSRRDELGQLARTFDGMADRIQALRDKEKTLLHDISHELRSPLTRLGLAVELGRSGADQADSYDRIEREAERLNVLVGELLNWSRSDGSVFGPQRDAVRLGELVEDLANISLLEAERKQCSLVVEVESEMTVHANRESLRRAVENVMSNAIRFAPPGSGIRIRLEREAGSICLRIRDDGPGVPEESLSRLFEAFYRVDSDRNRETGGVGLGLAIAARAIEAHSGRIHARNTHPGLEVTIELPGTLEFTRPGGNDTRRTSYATREESESVST